MSEPCANTPSSAPHASGTPTCSARDREVARLERQLEELRGVVVGLELDFELDRYQFEALIEWALEADARPGQVVGRLRPDVRTLLWRAAQDYGWSRPDTQAPLAEP